MFRYHCGYVGYNRYLHRHPNRYVIQICSPKSHKRYPTYPYICDISSPCIRSYPFISDISLWSKFPDVPSCTAKYGDRQHCLKCVLERTFLQFSIPVCTGVYWYVPSCNFFTKSTYQYVLLRTQGGTYWYVPVRTSMYHHKPGVQCAAGPGRFQDESRLQVP